AHDAPCASRDRAQPGASGLPEARIMRSEGPAEYDERGGRMKYGVLAPPRLAELAIAALVIAVVAMLIVPLPRPLLDLLLALNIGASVALLMAALLTPRPLSFAAFPTLLVVTTLFRVGLEV